MARQNTIHYIFYIDGSSYKPMYETMLGDIIDNPEVSIVWDNANLSIKKELLLKRKVQWLTKGYLDVLGYEENNLYTVIKQKAKENDHVNIIFFNGALHHNTYLAGTLRRYKKKFGNLRYILYYTDIVNCAVSRNAYYLQGRSVFDLIYTVDSADASKYNVFLWPTLYSVDNTLKYGDLRQDLYFCGVSKGRDTILLECLKKANKHGLRASMDIICYEDAANYQGFEDVVNIRTPNQYMPYSKVLMNELQAECILDVVQKGQMALTLRPYEAVVYNKKLLTNNKSILEFEFYNPRYMRYFEKVEDIDWEWVKEDTDVDYGYNGEFSPCLFLKRIERDLQNGK